MHLNPFTAITIVARGRRSAGHKPILSRSRFAALSRNGWEAVSECFDFDLELT